MFLNPLMLLGVSAVAAPIIIHLLNRRKFERVAWAAMRFLKVSVEQNQRRIQLEDLILLLLRCLLICLLALTAARLVSRSSTQSALGRTPVTAFIIIDNSLSMGATDGVSTRFERAKRAARGIIDTFPPASQAGVLLALATDKPGPIFTPTAALKFASDTIDRLEISERAGDLQRPLAQAMEKLAQAKGANKEIYIVTDGQQGEWARLDDIRKEVESDPAVRVHFVFVAEEQTANLGVSAVRGPGRLWRVDQPMRVMVDITNYGRSEAHNVEVAVSVDQEGAFDKQVVDAIPPRETRSVAFFPRLKAEGFHTITASLAQDRIPGDDARTIAVRAVKQARVLLVDGDPGAEPRDSEVFVLRAELQPAPPAERPDYFIQPRVVTRSELESAKLDDFDVVVLANVVDLSNAQADAAEQFVRRGGGLIVFPGASVNRTYYNDELFTRRGLLPAKLGEPAGDEKQQEKFFTLQSKGFSHPVASIWNDPNVGSFSTARIFRAFPLELGVKSAAEGGQGENGPQTPVPVIDFEQSEANGPVSGKPFMADRPFGRGRVILFASTADTAWNNLVVRPIFLALLHRTVDALLGGRADVMNVAAGEGVTLEEDPGMIGRDVVFRIPGAKADEPPPTRKVALNARESIATVSFDRTDRAGAYEARIGDGPALVFAAQPAAEESRLDLLDAAARKQLAQSAQVVEFNGSASAARAIVNDRVGEEWWLDLAVCALVLAALETLLAHWFSQAKAGFARRDGLLMLGLGLLLALPALASLAGNISGAWRILPAASPIVALIGALLAGYAAFVLRRSGRSAPERQGASA